MRVKYLFFLLSGLIFILYENLIQAAHIDVYSTEQYANIRLVGKIENGDAEKFKIVVEYLRQEKITVNMLMLASIGGDVIEAMQIGRIVRKLYIPTHAPLNLDADFICNGYPEGLENEDCDCASACFLIWVAGIYRMGDLLGIHRQLFLEEYLEGLSSSEAQKENSLMYNRIRSYLKSMDVPEHIIDKMFNSKSDEIAYLDWNTAKSMEFAPFFDEWIGQSCLGLTSEEEMYYWELVAKKMRRKSTLTKSEQFSFNYLKEKEKKFNKCIREKIKEMQLQERATL